MKKLCILLSLIILTGSQSVFAGNDPLRGKVKSGEYICKNKEGQTCYFKRMGLTSGGHGPACPILNMKNMEPDQALNKYYNDLAVFLNNPEYCTYKEPKAQKYVCNYNPGYAEVFVENRKVIMVQKNTIEYPMFQYYYKPSKCKLVPWD